MVYKYNCFSLCLYSISGGGIPNYIAAFVKYLNKKCQAYKSLGFDFCNKMSKNASAFKGLHGPSLRTTSPALQQQIEDVLELQLTGEWSVNYMVIDIYAMDALKLFHCYQNCMENCTNSLLLKKSFDLYQRSLPKCLVFLSTAEKHRLDRDDPVIGYIAQLKNIISDQLQECKAKLNKGNGIKEDNDQQCSVGPGTSQAAVVTPAEEPASLASASPTALAEEDATSPAPVLPGSSLTTKAPTAEAPTIEVPMTETPTIEVPMTEAPTIEVPMTEAPTSANDSSTNN